MVENLVIKYMKIHVVTPFSRWQLKDIFTEQLEKYDIIWHPITYQKEFITDKEWITPININIEFPEYWDICYWKLNYFIHNANIIDNDYYMIMNDDDDINDNVFSEVSKMNNDVVFISSNRGYRKGSYSICGFNKLIAERGLALGLGQGFYKGSVLKTIEFTNYSGADVLVTKDIEKRIKDIAYRPDLFLKFNYYEPLRWDK